MIPAALFAMLAIARLGAIHAVVFGGFSPSALAQRIEASRPVAVMTASCGIEGAKKPTEYKSMIEGAIQKSRLKPSKTIVWQREQMRWDPVLKEQGQRNWQRLVKSARNRGVKTEAVPIQSGDGLYQRRGSLCGWPCCWIELLHQVFVRGTRTWGCHVHSQRHCEYTAGGSKSERALCESSLTFFF